MTRAWSYALVATMAFAAGIVFGIVAFDAEAPPDDTARARNERTSPVRATETERAPPRKRRHATPIEHENAAETGLSAAALGAPATESELAFLRRALADERRRVAQAQADEEERQRERQLQSDDDGLTVLDRYLRRGSDVTDVVASFASMRAHIRTDAGPVRRIEATSDRTPVDLTEVAAGHTVLEFGEGTFVLDRGSDGWNVRRENVQSLEIRGAGMDKTTLVGPGWAFLCANKKAQIKNLVIRDLTIDSIEKEQIVLDARGGIAAAIERVRFAGWVVAGHASALGVSGDAFLALRDCVFENSAGGFVLSLRGPGLAVFERCTFEGARCVVIADSHSSGLPATVRLIACDFGTVRVADRNLHRRGGGGADVEIRGGTASAGPASWTEAERIKNFGAVDVVSMQGLTFRSTMPTFSVSDAAAAFELAVAAGLGNVAGFSVVNPGVKPVELDFYVLDGVPGSVAKRKTLVYDGKSVFAPEKEPRRGVGHAPDVAVEDLHRAQSFAALLRNAEIAADENVESVLLRALGSPSRDIDAPRPLLLMVELAGRKRIHIDAVSGRVTQRN